MIIALLIIKILLILIYKGSDYKCLRSKIVQLTTPLDILQTTASPDYIRMPPCLAK